ncbi:TPA: DUF1366 domain-containing protein [Streptococcus agalactiae]|uniref:DUF1366 domain-containing protein n=1 Tax=Streptococcus agalactiae TaxID=1311 RepID=UPI001C969A2D|nr:DUF1366 domain-containing protein [Streptococcus agalactiae]MBY5048027.1 DUF1366 domain-containing protein [Streptococcus agalactiae]
MEILNKYPVMLEDKSIAKVNAIVAVKLPHVRGNLTFDLPVDFDNKSFAETLEKCEQIFYDEKYKDKAQAEKLNKLDSSSKAGLQSTMKLVEILYKKGTLTDEDLMVIN